MTAPGEDDARKILVEGQRVFFDLCQARTVDELLKRVQAVASRSSDVALRRALCFAVAQHQWQQALDGEAEWNELSRMFEHGVDDPPHPG